MNSDSIKDDKQLTIKNETAKYISYPKGAKSIDGFRKNIENKSVSDSAIDFKVFNLDQCSTEEVLSSKMPHQHKKKN